MDRCQLDGCLERAESTIEDGETLKEVLVCEPHFNIIEGICETCGKNRIGHFSN